MGRISLRFPPTFDLLAFIFNYIILTFPRSMTFTLDYVTIIQFFNLQCWHKWTQISLTILFYSFHFFKALYIVFFPLWPHEWEVLPFTWNIKDTFTKYKFGITLFLRSLKIFLLFLWNWRFFFWRSLKTDLHSPLNVTYFFIHS